MATYNSIWVFLHCDECVFGWPIIKYVLEILGSFVVFIILLYIPPRHPLAKKAENPSSRCAFSGRETKSGGFAVLDQQDDRVKNANDASGATDTILWKSFRCGMF